MAKNSLATAGISRSLESSFCQQRVALVRLNTLKLLQTSWFLERTAPAHDGQRRHYSGVRDTVVIFQVQELDENVLIPNFRTI